MDSPGILHQYFRFSETQEKQFTKLQDLYVDWNSRVNLISRQDIDNLYERHVLHSLAIAKVLKFNPKTHILDIGTGGGFPGIPLAIYFPDCQFHLVDSIGKKIRAVEEIIYALNLQNCYATHARAEQVKDKPEFVVSRGVAEIPKMIKWVRTKVSSKSTHDLPNGLLCLKGENVNQELKEVKQAHHTFPLKDYFREEFFTTKVLVHIEMDY